MKRLVYSLLIVFLLVTFSYSQETPIITRDKGTITIENDDYKIKWDLEITGHTPYDNNKYILEGTELVSKGIDRTVDIAIISPEKFMAGSKAYLWKDTNYTWTRLNKFSCDNEFSEDYDLGLDAKYGWIIPDQTAYCNITYPIWKNPSNNTVVDTYDIEYQINTTADNYLDTSNAPNNVTLYWNTTRSKVERKQLDITPIFNHITQNTSYGDEIYYVRNVTFKADKPYKFLFEINVNQSVLPLKYSVCFGNLTSNTLYFCLDPTITTARTWTTDVDFTNGTIMKDMNATEGELTLKTPVPFLNTTWDSQTAEGWYQWDTDGGTADWSNGYFFTSSATEATYGYNISLDSSSDSWKITGHVMGDTTSPKHRHAYLFIMDTYSGTDTTGNYSRLVIFHYQNSLVYFGEDSVLGNSCAWNTATNFEPKYFEWEINLSTGATMVEVEDDSGTVICTDTFTNPFNDNEDIVAVSSYSNAVDYRSAFDNITIEWLNYSTLGNYSDLQNWTPQSGNQITNISIETSIPANTAIQFFYNNTNASLYSSLGTELSDGTNEIDLDLGNDEELYYWFNLSGNGTVTPTITSYTINEATISAGDSCDTNNWDCSESCTVAGLDAGGSVIRITGTGVITISGDVTNCATSGDRIIRSGGSCRIIRSGAVTLCGS